MIRVVRWLLGLALAAVLVASGWWAGRAALESPEDPLDVAAPVTYQVVAGEVGRWLTFAAVAEWSLESIGVGSAQGVVTSVAVDQGTEVAAGEVLLTVDLRPVIAAQGTVPSFRDLASKSEGPDVVQLQEMLTELGHYSGEIDGIFGSGVRAAVRAWQKSLGVKDDGVVRAGDIVFVPSLPVRIVLDSQVTVGARLAGGEDLVWLVPDTPEFWIPLSVEQRNLVPLSAEVAVTYADGVWPARIVMAQEGEFDQLNLILEAPDGGAVCGDGCVEWVALANRTDFRAEIVVEPKVSGPVVPSAGLGTDAGGQPFVTLADGTEVPVTIVGASDGLAVVDGVSVGDELLLPFERPPEE
ncbi:MAG: peptidoglycan-binding protein [Acidimicrobiia bacterium]|nr:peptidoglycan-binding protein [Acidimicrobiia bacterium]